MEGIDRIMENRKKGEKRVFLPPPHDRWHLCNGSNFQAGDSSPGAPVVPPSLLVPLAERDESVLFKLKVVSLSPIGFLSSIA